jgi:ankyrin repeat protein
MIDPFQGQFTALMWASYQGHARVVEYLLQCGANVDALDEHGLSSLSWAAGRNHLDIVRLLLTAGASPNLCDKNNTTPLIWASRRGMFLRNHRITRDAFLLLRLHGDC